MSAQEVASAAERTSAADLIARAEAAIADEDTAMALLLLDEAERLGVEPDRCAGNRWLAHMLRGDFGAAWRESDAIRRRGAADPHRFWNGEELNGRRVVVRSLHGFGDAVQMFRFLPRLQARASHLIVEVPPRLVELAPCFEGMGEVITWGDAAPPSPPVWDVQLEVMELPYLFRVSAQELEPTSGYLRLPDGVTEATRKAMGSRQIPRVGVVWRAGEWNGSRSVPAELAFSLGSVTGVEFWSLQGGAEAQAGAPGWRNVCECGDGILPLAAVVAELDLVITVDTLAAHLAGALGIPCWLLLQSRADWRWMSRREDTPWYPSLRLLRGEAEGGWERLLLRVCAELEAWAGRRRTASVER